LAFHVTFLTRDEAAARACRSRRQIDRLIESGRLTTVRLGGRTFITEKVLEAYLELPAAFADDLAGDE
jgi:excisionase family DNA binding protein